jgi:hypothetical protein
MPWDYRRYGSATDPVHKSHLNSIVGGDYGCPRKFRYEMDAKAEGVPGLEELPEISGKAAAGTAAHETIARALGNEELCARLLEGKGGIAATAVAHVFMQEFEREVGGRSVQWYQADESETLKERVTMITALLSDLHKYVAKVELLEAGFIVQVGKVWLSGHVDIVYRPRSNPERIAMGDWKTGANKPSSIELDHGWEAGVYSAAVHHGRWLPRGAIRMVGSTATLLSHSVTHPSRYIAEREVMERSLIDVARELESERGGGDAWIQTMGFNEFPTEIYTVHMADYVPYKKAGTKLVKRAEDLQHYGYERPTTHRFEAGHTRGPAWLPVKLSEYDMPRLEARLANVVGMIRMGRFVDNVGDRCLHCSYKDDCLTGGYAPRGDERKQLELALKRGDDVAAALATDFGEDA